MATSATLTSRRWRIVELGGLAVTAAVALALRLAGYTKLPPYGDNLDEAAWSWQGLGLITKHVPYGWSNIQEYANFQDVVYAGRHIRMVHPWLDHPPLFGLIVGLWAYAAGVRDFLAVTPGVIRLVPIALSVIAVGLAYLLGRRVLGRGPAAIGTVMFATSAAAVLFGRLVEAEALLAVMFLVALLLSIRVIDTGSRGSAAVVVALCAAAPLAKLSGIAVAMSVAALLFSTGRVKIAVGVFAAGVLGSLAFLAYGAAYDVDLLANVIAASDSHRFGVMGLYEFIAAPAGPGRGIRDGLWLLGWLGIAELLTDDARVGPRFITWPVVLYAVLIMLLAEQLRDFGWFKITIYPLVYLAAGSFAFRMVSQPSLPRLLLFLVVAGGSATTVLFGTPASPWVLPLEAALLVLGLPALLLLLTQHPGADPSLRGRASQVGAAVLGVVLALVLAQNLVLDRVSVAFNPR